MSRITLSGNPSGTGTFTIASPNSNTDRTLNLPDAAGTVVTDTATQTLTNKTIQGGALTFATAVNSTSGTAIDFTGIPSWARRITVSFDGVSTTGTALKLLQIGDSGGVETTGYVSGTFNGVAANTFATSTVGFVLSVVNNSNSTNAMYGHVTLVNYSGNSWTLSGSIHSAGYQVGTASSGAKSLSATLDRVRVTTTGSDTFNGGVINIMYEG